jgi:hypothetical protein
MAEAHGTAKPLIYSQNAKEKEGPGFQNPLESIPSLI